MAPTYESRASTLESQSVGSRPTDEKDSAISPTRESVGPEQAESEEPKRLELSAEDQTRMRALLENKLKGKSLEEIQTAWTQLDSLVKILEGSSSAVTLRVDNNLAVDILASVIEGSGWDREKQTALQRFFQEEGSKTTWPERVFITQLGREIGQGIKLIQAEKDAESQGSQRAAPPEIQTTAEPKAEVPPDESRSQEGPKKTIPELWEELESLEAGRVRREKSPSLAELKEMSLKLAASLRQLEQRIADLEASLLKARPVA